MVTTAKFLVLALAVGAACTESKPAIYGGDGLVIRAEKKEEKKEETKRKYKSWKPTHRESVAINGCSQLLSKETTFTTGKNQGSLYCKKKNAPMIGSMVYCLKNTPFTHSIQGFIDMCAEDADVILTMDEIDQIYNNASNYVVFNPKKTVPGWNKSEPANVPVGFSEARYKLGYDAALTRYFNVNYSMWFGIAILGYWFGVLFIAGICNLTYYLFPGMVKKMNNKVINVFRKHISLPATFMSQHVEPRVRMFRWVSWIVPTRLESILMLGYIAIVIAGNSAYLKHYDNNPFFDSSLKEGAKLAATRSGVTGMWVIPQLILFAGRNNLMQWLSGWSYSRFINIHKWNARVMSILIFIHAISYSISGGGYSKGSKLLSWYQTDWMRWGVVAFTCMCLLCFHSLFALRHKIYDVFLLSHILLAVFAIAGGWIHCRAQGYQEWYIAATSVWVFDRVVRIARILFFGIRTAEVQLLADETLRVTVKRPSWWKASPGAHAFIHFFRPTCFWQSHPFTVVQDATDADTVVGEHTMTMYLKVKGGTTHSLYQYLSTCPGQKAKISVGVEGPYGHPLPLQKFDTCVFLTGGHGIPGLYAQARALVGTKTNVKFYWAIRHYKSIEWFYPELQKLNGAGNVQTVIYVSQPEDHLTWSTSSDPDSEHEEKKSDNDEISSDAIAQLKSKLNHIEFREGRPDIEELVTTDTEDAHGSIAFTTCGHGSMVDATRKAIADTLDKTTNRVDLFEQAQIW